MKLLKKPSLLKPVEKEVTVTPEKKRTTTKKLPPDAYKDEIDPIDLYVDENRKLVLSVKRGGEDGLPMCDIRQFQTTDTYTGFTKKGVNFPVELLPDLIELLQVVYGDCEERELF